MATITLKFKDSINTNALLTTAQFISTLKTNPQQHVKIENNIVIKARMRFYDLDGCPKTLSECKDYDNITIICKDGSVDVIFDGDKFILAESDKSRQLDKYTFILGTTDSAKPTVPPKKKIVRVIKKVLQPFTFK